jgi:hypothetical protein
VANKLVGYTTIRDDQEPGTDVLDDGLVAVGKDHLDEGNCGSDVCTRTTTKRARRIGLVKKTATVT